MLRVNESHEKAGVYISIEGDYNTVVREWSILTNQILADIYKHTGKSMKVEDLIVDGINSQFMNKVKELHNWKAVGEQL